ncbi:amino acid ABC transporter substrate-binding protein (PAAT family) [Acinetobacter calcoaceticus]|uniref:Amino acid ABC transporter substrate-binding protein (PAAT family) n=1 Tax=Acinetobacter calcoaceticus TaxID=471 RepID=A0A4R1XUE1_ACICA|nr:amino acid ABC transporter substrate-binding protein (PAAT family) [Acinetobacter calcoaceticus]
MNLSKALYATTLVLSLATLSACSKEPAQTQTNTDQAKTETANKTVTVGMDIAFPPFEYMENGQPKGFDVEIMNQIMKSTNASAQYIDTRFYNLITGIKGKKFDVVISGLYVTPERMQQVDMIPYYKTTQAVVVKKEGNYKPKLRDDLCGKTIATQKGTNFPTQLKSISEQNCIAKGKAGIKVLEFETSPQAIQAVLSNAADADFDDIVALRLAVEKLADRIEITSTDPFFAMYGGIVIRKGDTATHQLVSQGLENIKKSGEYQSTLAKFGLSEPSEDEIKAIYASAQSK